MEPKDIKTCSKMSDTDLDNLILELQLFTDWYTSAKGCESIWHKGSTPESHLMETGVRHKEKTDTWMSNKESRAVFPNDLKYWVHYKYPRMEAAIREMGDRVFKFVILAHNRDNKTNQAVIAKEVYVSRTSLWRRKKKWYIDIFNRLKRKGII